MRQNSLPSHRTFTNFKGAAGKTILLCGALLGTGISAKATSYTWAGGTGNWDNTAAWSPSGTYPGQSQSLATPDTITINGTGSTSATINWGSTAGGRYVSGITVTGGETGATTFAQDGTGAFTRNLFLGSGGISIASGAGAVTIGSATANQGIAAQLTANQTWTNNSSNALTLVNNVSNQTSYTTPTNTPASTTPVTLSLAGSGNFNFASTGTITDSGGTGGTLALSIGGTGTVAINSIANTYTGGTTINSGTVTAYTATSGTISAANFGTGSVTMNGGRLLLGNSASSSAVATYANNFNLNGGTVIAQDGYDHLSGTVNVGTGTTTVGSMFDNAPSSRKGLWLDGAITGTGNLVVSYLGAGTGSSDGSIFRLTNGSGATVNSYTGTITINGNSVATGGGTYLLLDTNAGAALTNATVNLNGSNAGGQFSSNTSSGLAFNLSNAAIGGVTGNGNLVLTNVSGGNVTLTIGGGSTNATTSFSGAVSGGGSIAKSGTGTLTLSGADTYSGSTTVTAGTLSLTGTNSGAGSYNVNTTGVLNLSSSGTIAASSMSIGNTGIVNVTGGTYTGTTLSFQNTGSTLNLNGGVFALTSTIASNSSGAIINFNGGTLKNGNAGSTTNTIAASGSTFAVNILSGGGTIDTTGGAITSSNIIGSATSTGTLTVQGGHALTTKLGNMGGTTLSGSGTSLVDTSATTSAGALTVGSGTTFDMSGNSDSFGGLAGAGNVINSGTAGQTLTLAGAGTNTFSGVYSGGVNATTAGTGALTISSGTEILSGVNLYTGATTVANGATLQLQNVNAIASSALNLSSGSTLALRANTASSGTTTTFVPASIVLASGSSTFNFDVNNLGAGTGNTVALTGGLTFGSNTNDQINVTGGGGTTLALGAVANAGASPGGTFTTTINATTAGVSISSYTASTWGTNLILQGGNNITFGSSATPTATTTLTSSSNGYFNVTVNGAVVTIYGTYANPGVGQHTLTLSSGQLNLNSTAASGNETFNINGGTLDNTSGGSLTETGNAPIIIGGNFTFGGSNALNMGTGGVTVTGSQTATINGSTLTMLGGLNLSGASLTKAGAGSLVFGGVNFTGTGNKLANSGTGTMTLGALNNGNGYTIDFSTTGGAITTTTTNGNPTGLNLFISGFDTVNNGADFAAVNGSNVIVGRNSIATELTFTGTGGTSGNVYKLSTSATTSGASQTLGSLIINDTGTGDTLTIGANNLVLGGGGNGSLLYNGGATGSYTIASTGGLLTGGTGHTMNINTYAGTLTISAQIINGSGQTFDTLQKGGAGTLILTGANSFGGTSGGINLGGGTLDLGNGNTGSYGGTVGTINILGGSTLGIGLANGSTIGAPIALTSGTLNGIELSGVTNTLSGGILGAGNITQSGAGTTVLSGSGINGVTSFFTGAVNINAGAIEITNAGAFGATGSTHMTSGITVASGAALQIANNISTTGAYALTLNGAGVTGAAHGALESVSGTNTYTGNITLGSNSAIGADSGSSLTASGNVGLGAFSLTSSGAGNTSLSGTVSGTGGLTVSGTGTTTLSAAAGNTYTGQTTVSNGELDLNGAGVTILGAGANNVATAPDVLVNGGTLKFLLSNQMGTVSGAGNATLSLTSGTVSLNGTTQTVYAFQNTGGTFTTGAGDLIGTGATISFAGGTNTINSGGIIEDGHFAISGGTNTVQGGGTLELDASGQGIVFSNGANLTLNSASSSPGQIILNSGFGGTFTISSTASSSTASITSGGSATQAGLIDAGGVTLGFNTAAGTVANNGADLSVGATITDGAVSKTGAGFLAFTGKNTYTGTTTITNGMLEFVNAASFYNSNGGSVTSTNAGKLSVASGATVTLGVGSGTTYFTAADVSTILSRSPTGFASGANIGFDTTNAGGNFTYGAGIPNAGGNLGMVKLGTGTLTLSGASTYSGGTTVKKGALIVTNTTGSATGTGAVTVSGSGQLLGGTGAISGPVTVSSGATLYSGAVTSGTPATGTGTGMVLSSALNISSANLTFALNTGGTAGFANPNTTTSFISTGSTVNFTGTDSISLVDLTNGNLTLRNSSPYLLISSSMGNAGFSGLVTLDNTGTLSLDGNGYVVGVYVSGSAGSYVYNPIAFNQFGSDGVTLLNATQSYPGPQLFLYNGNLEVVPEPGTWAMMLCGLGVLLFWQRRGKSKE